MELYDAAVGECIVCGADATGSLYWLDMTESQWVTIRPYIVHLFPPDMVQNPFFVPELNRPFCGALCSHKHKEMTDGKTT